jgi:hypothetical protein
VNRSNARNCKDILITMGGIGWPEVGGNSIPRTLNL